MKRVLAILFGISVALASCAAALPPTSGAEKTRELGVGWNLGNTLDAPIREESWGNPRTTQEMIDAVLAAGFRTLRIPVTWHWHMGPEPDYTIDPVWLARVKEVVDYGYGIGMHVIINVHHDDYNWLTLDESREQAVTAQFTRLWEQVAACFSEYDERLLFEAANEPRVAGAATEWTGGTRKERAVLNRLNAAFIRVVRASGGNNATRWLILPACAASISPLALFGMKLPCDARVIASVHSYLPTGLTFVENQGHTKFSFWDCFLVKFTMWYVKLTFAIKGVPVLLGEFGAVHKQNTADRAAYYGAVVSQARRHGFACCVWDNGLLYGGDPFALLNRTTLEWPYPEIMRAIQN